MSTEAKTAVEKPKVSIAKVLEYLAAGKTRKEIGAIYGLNGSQVNLLFQNPYLKGKKVHVEPTPAFELVDDAPEGTSTYVPRERKARAAKTVENTTDSTISSDAGQVKEAAVAETAAPATEETKW